MNIHNPEVFRTNIVNKLNDIVHHSKKSINIEKGVFNYTIREAEHKKVIQTWDNPHFVCIYVTKLRSVFTNLKNPDGLLLQQLNDSSIKSHSLAELTHQEMCPSKWEKLIEQKSKKDKSIFENKTEAATSTFMCRKCHSRNCTYYMQQTRSADEPMTIFVTCIDCGQRFKTS